MSETVANSDSFPESNCNTPSPRPPSRGDGRKQLPSIPSPDVQATLLCARPVNKQPTKPQGANGYGPFFQEYSLMAEFNQLHRQKLPGVYVLPSAKSPSVWNGVLFVRQGTYQEGVFRFTMTIPENYPDGDCPSLVFEFPLFHPVVDPQTGELDVKRAFPKWRRNVHHLWQVLLYARRIFYKIETKSPLNLEAADLYHQEPELFKKKVQETVKAAKERIYQPTVSDDPFAIRFFPWEPAVHQSAKTEMLNAKKSPSEERSSSPSTLGLSWMLPGSTQIFSREDPATA